MAAEKQTREVITLQVGNYSNFIGAHFWNLQEALVNASDKQNEINHDILYREGQNIAGEKTYKPRAICFDLKANFSNSKQYSELSDELEAPAWEGAVEKYERGPTKPDKLTEELEILREKSTYLKSQYEYDQTGSTHPLTALVNSRSFEHSITSWLDYSQVCFHEKSFHRVKGTQNDEGQILGNFGSGERLFETRRFQDDFEDKLHFFAEECDRLQGFQIFSDVHDSFGGLASGILQELAEEYSKKACVCFSLMPTVFADDTRHTADRRLLNILLSLSRYISSSSQIVPLSLRNSFGLKSEAVKLPWIDYKQSSSYHTSAVLATAVATTTLSGRLTTETINTSLLTGNLPGDNRKISSLSLSLPVPVNSKFTPHELLKGNDYERFSNHFTSLTPDVTKPSNVLTESVVVRGIPHHLLRKNDYPQIEGQLCSLLQPVVKYFPGSYFGCVVEQPCLLTPLFPDIFKPCVTPVGCVVDDYSRAEGNSVQKISAMTRLQCCEEISQLVEELTTGARKANIRKQPGFLEEGIDAEDFQTSMEDMTTMAQAYHNKYEL